MWEDAERRLEAVESRLEQLGAIIARVGIGIEVELERTSRAIRELVEVTRVQR